MGRKRKGSDAFAGSNCHQNRDLRRKKDGGIEKKTTIVKVKNLDQKIRKTRKEREVREFLKGLIVRRK